MAVPRHFFPLRNIDDVVLLFRRQLDSKNGGDLSLLSLVIGYIETSLTSNLDRSNALSRNIHAHDRQHHQAANASRRNIVEDDRVVSGNDFPDDDGPCEVKIPVVEWNSISKLYDVFKSRLREYIDIDGHDPVYCDDKLLRKVTDLIWNTLGRSYVKDRAHASNLYSYLKERQVDPFGAAYAVVAALQCLGYDDVHLVLSEDHVWVEYGPNSSSSAEVTWHDREKEDKRDVSIESSIEKRSWLYLNGQAVRCSRAMEIAALITFVNPSISGTVSSQLLSLLQQKLLWMLHDGGHLERYPIALGTLGDLEDARPSSCRKSALSLYEAAIQSGKTLYDDQHVYPYMYLAGYFYRKHRYREALQNWSLAANVLRSYNHCKADQAIYRDILDIALTHIPVITRSVEGEPGLLGTPEGFAYLLEFYDGVCQWEEGSDTPVLHSLWAKHLVGAMNKFERHAREAVEIFVDSTDGKEHADSKDKIRTTKGTRSSTAGLPGPIAVDPEKQLLRQDSEELIQTEIKKLESRVGAPGELRPEIAELASRCGESILNPEFLLHGGDPFPSLLPGEKALCPLPPRFISPTAVTLPHLDLQVPEPDGSRSHGEVHLKSAKMIGMRQLLTAEKLNVSAIQLQLTAQSQVHMKQRRPDSEYSFHQKRTKRL